MNLFVCHSTIFYVNKILFRISFHATKLTFLFISSKSIPRLCDTDSSSQELQNKDADMEFIATITWDMNSHL